MFSIVEGVLIVLVGLMGPLAIAAYDRYEREFALTHCNEIVSDFLHVFTARDSEIIDYSLLSVGYYTKAS